MSLKQTLKDKWNRLQCRLDGANVDLFASYEVDNALRDKGWKIETQSMILPTPYPMIRASGAFTIVTDPRGDIVRTTQQRREYLDARRDAAERVYGLK